MEQQCDDEELSHVTWVDAGGRENGMCKGPVVEGKMENEVSKEGRVHIWGSTKWSMVGNGMKLFYPKRKRGKLWSILNMRVIDQYVWNGGERSRIEKRENLFYNVAWHPLSYPGGVEYLKWPSELSHVKPRWLDLHLNQTLEVSWPQINIGVGRVPLWSWDNTSRG